MIKTTLMSSCHWKTLVPFCMQKKRPENAFLTLTMDRTGKKIMPSKTTVSWLFKNICCYLVIAFFDWKIGVFQQTVVRVYYILKQNSATAFYQLGF